MVLLRIFFSFLAGAAFSQTITLTVGSSTTVSIPENTEVKITAKGVIDAWVKNKNDLVITGLRKGFVILSILESEEVLERFSISVTPKEEKEKTTRNDEQSDQYDMDACRRAHLVCHDQRIEGESSDIDAFWMAKLSCQNGCFFQAKIIQPALQQFVSSVNETLHEEASAQMDAMGNMVLDVDCQMEERVSEEAVAYLKRKLGNFGEQAIFRCSGVGDFSNYILKAKILALDTHDQKNIGLNLGQTFSVAGQNLPQNFVAALQNNIGEVIGNPEFVLTPGKEAVAHSGGEILAKIVAQKSNKEEIPNYFHRFGMELKVQLFKALHDQFYLKYNFQLRHPLSQTVLEVFSSNSLESVAKIHLEESLFLGGIEYKQDGELEKSLPFVQKIPILGPLLRFQTQNRTVKKIYILFSLHKPSINWFQTQPPQWPPS